MCHARIPFAVGALLCGALALLACSRGEDDLVMEEVVVDEIDVAAAPGADVEEADAVASILAGIRSAREDIARGDSIDAQFALDAPADLLEGIVGQAGDAGAPEDLAGEQIPLAQAYALLMQAREHLDKGDLAAADLALKQAEEQARITPEGIPYGEGDDK